MSYKHARRCKIVWSARYCSYNGSHFCRGKQITYRPPSASIHRVAPLLRPADTEVATLAKMLNEAESVTILAGAGCAGSHAELMQLAQKLKAPIVTTIRGREHVEYDNPYDVGLTGLIDYSSGFHAMMACDTLLMLGTDFPYTQFYPENATTIQIDRRGENLGGARLSIWV